MSDKRAKLLQQLLNTSPNFLRLLLQTTADSSKTSESLGTQRLATESKMTDNLQLVYNILKTI
jgi:hypothetical protein